MIIKQEINNSKLKFFFEFEKTDREKYKTRCGKIVKSSQKSCYFILPSAIDPYCIHNDILALTALLVIYPFIGKRLKMPYIVSHDFHNKVKKYLKIDIGPTELKSDNNDKKEFKTIEPRQIPDPQIARPSICFSNGVDSTAGLMLMPPNTVAVFQDRIFNPSRNYLYNKDNVYYGINMVSQKLPNDFYMIKTNIEDVRVSNGFAIDIGVGVSAILLSDYLNFDSIAYGYCLHDIEQINPEKIPYVCTGDHTKFNYNGWNEIYKSVGLYLNFVTMGLTEIGTWKIALNSPISGLSSACMRGRLHRPCMKCGKCFRKTMLRIYLENGNSFNNLELNKSNLLKKILKLKYGKKDTIFDQHGIESTIYYITKNYSGNKELFKFLKEHYRENLSKKTKNILNKYLDKWIQSGEQFIYPRYVSYVRNQANKLLVNQN